MNPFRFALAALLAASALPARAAVDPSELLPVEQAFALSATATARDRIEFRWQIAEGYYLYRHRIAVQPVDASFKFNPLELPPGEKKTDEFFGAVETYRSELRATLTGAAASGVEQIVFNVRYQGCADVGVCYPPHQQRVTVALPAEDAGGGTNASTAAVPTSTPLLGTTPASLPPATTNPLQQALGGSTAMPAAGVENLPLPEAQAFGFEAIATSPTELLLRFTPAPGYYLYRDRSSFRIVDDAHVGLASPRWPEGEAHHDEHFGQVVVYFSQVEVPLPLRRTRTQAESITLEATFQGCQTDGICYPPMTRRVALTLPEAAPEQVVSTTAPPAAAAGRGSFFAALLLALGGGLILNLMPCVLPVLSLKALSLAESGRSGGHARAGALWYTLGVLVSFIAVGLLVLALRAAGQALGWGFQLQQPLVIAALAYVMVAIGFNLSGVFELGAGLAGSGQRLTERSGAAGDFFTGVLAVVVASPCTAPFMGTALAFAFAAPAPLALAVFAALGLGLALPFLLLGFVPALARLLPRPGAWMQTFKQVLAFPMYLTAIWLLWVLGKQRGVDAIGIALVGLVPVAAGLWWWGRQGLQRAPLARGVALLLLALGVSSLWLVDALPRVAAGEAESGTTRYSAAALAELRAQQRVVFVNMTADWCVTCKANERNVLGGAAFRDALQRADAVYMKGDWTNVDPQITAFLEAHGAVGVPLYVVFPRDGGAGEVLPTVLTQAIVDEALARAAR